MVQSPELSIVVPMYNEEANIGFLIPRIIKSVPKKMSFEIIPVNDCSTDGTGRILSLMAGGDGRIKPVHRSGERGVGRALRAGFDVAQGKLVVTMDADLSHLPATIPRLIEVLEEKEADVVLGSRYVKNGKIFTSPLRIFISGFFNKLTRLFFKSDLHDFTTGFRCHKKTVLESLGLESNGFEIHVEIPLKAIKKGYAVCETPITYERRKCGSSKLKYFKEGPAYIKTVLKALICD